jgi:uncharacterized protein (DUF1800 family)
MSQRALSLILPAFLLLFSGAPAGAAPSDDALLLHALHRLTYGPRPGDLEALRRQGLPAFLEEQLRPDRLPDAACDRVLADFPDQARTAQELLHRYPQPGLRLQGSENLPSPMTERDERDAYKRLWDLAQEAGAVKLTRATLSRRQTYEVMVDFWFNHFNVHVQKDQVQWLAMDYERTAIRPHALGRFADLLKAVARHPAMLVYLDNIANRADPKFKPTARGGGMMMQAAPGSGPRLNENYARELLELHTLGVEGGYTQQDVVEAARVLTGWGVSGLGYDTAPQPVAFRFKPWAHDTNPKVVLGKAYGPDGGVAEGEGLLRDLACHPSTARHIAWKLCRRFVADDPPPALVARVAETFLKTDGDIRETLRAVILSPEFSDPRHFGAKFRTPLEFVAASIRATGARVRRWDGVLWQLEGMGMPPYRCEAPTGYPDTRKAWSGSSSLLGRANFAWDIFSRSDAGPIRLDLAPYQPAPGEGGDGALRRVQGRLLPGGVEASPSPPRRLSKGP